MRRLTKHFWRVTGGAALLLALATPASANPFPLTSPLTLTYSGVLTSSSAGLLAMFPELVAGTSFWGTITLEPHGGTAYTASTSAAVGQHANLGGQAAPFSQFLRTGSFESTTGGGMSSSRGFLMLDTIKVNLNTQVLALLTAGILNSATGNLGTFGFWGTGYLANHSSTGGYALGTITSVSVPEPSTLLLLSAGFGLGAYRRARARKKVARE